MFWLLLIEVILIAIAVLAAVDFFNIIFRGAAPFMKTNKKILTMIISELKLKGQETVYELGAGGANFLQAVEKKYPQAKLIGVEYSWWIYLITKMTLKKRKSGVRLLRGDMFKADIKNADLIYVFLIPTMMMKLSEKIMKECRPKTMVVSYLFSIPNLTIVKKLDINGNSLYFYEV